jgi:CRISPR/Cas system CSM-associated protein Csm4 (group 5 of RAMP superfamily)
MAKIIIEGNGGNTFEDDMKSNYKHIDDYKSWVKANGHLTHNASSVLDTYIKDKGLSKSHRDMIARHLHF